MEKIYTIPINDAFDGSDGCPFCRMKSKLESDEISLILGASMMEPDIRIKTNEKGFCGKHYEALLSGQKRLPLALLLQSHLNEIAGKCSTPKIAVKGKLAAVFSASDGFCKSCYICEKVEFHLSKMFDTTCYMWENDADFRKKFDTTQFFCLPCYSRMLKSAEKNIKRKSSDAFLTAAQSIEMKYLAELAGDVSHFCRKFDYRFENEPWGNAKGSVERAITFLSGNQDHEK